MGIDSSPAMLSQARLRAAEEGVELDLRVPLEMCPTCKVQTGAAASIEEHRPSTPTIL